MDPYLEQPGSWEVVHWDLIEGIQQFLMPILRPYYYLAIEQRAYLTVSPPAELVLNDPKALMVPFQDEPQESNVELGPRAIEPVRGQLPVPEKVTERYLEIRIAETQEVITVIEVLSPGNKRFGEGRGQYERQRLVVLGSPAHLVEIDLLRGGQPPTMNVAGQNDYRIVISRSEQRPQADVYLFSIRQAIPDAPIPLRFGGPEPTLMLNHILHQLYQKNEYGLAVDYRKSPPPPEFSKSDLAWLKPTTRSV
jgi:hypothetical protein